MYNILNKRGESLSGDTPSKGADTKKFLSIAALISVLLIIIAIGAGFLFSAAGQRSIASADAMLSQFDLGAVSNFYSSLFSLGAGDYFNYNTNSSSKKSGVDLVDFSSVAGETFPAGYPIDLLYKIDYYNVPRDSTYDAEFSCYFNITKKDDKVLEIPEKIFGQIIPSSEMTIRKDSQPICRFTGDQTADLDKDAYIFYGSFSFDYATKDVSIPVYFISGKYADFLGDSNYFDDIHLTVSSSDLATIYNGEPLSIAIAVGGEDQVEQPIIIRSGEAISYNAIGITLKNEWGGDLQELEDFTLSLPDGITLNDDLNGEPSPSCPFISIGQENRYNVYKLDESMVSFFDNYIVSNDFWGKSNFRNFQCWLDIDPEILNGQEYIPPKYYKAEATYIYKVKEKYTSISIIPPGSSLIVEGI